jgi:thiazolylpeptide-type bacteriocin precursor
MEETMNENVELPTLIEELRTLESETFEIRDYTDAPDLLMVPICSTTSSTTSTTSCSS